MRWTGLAAAALLAACAPAAKTADKGAIENVCAASATAPWQANTVEAFTSGPSCAHAVATIVVRAPDGAALMTEAAPVEHLFGLNEAADPATMKQKLAEWIDQKDSALASAGKLPEWKADAETPGGEFPFYPEAGFDRAAYEELRAANAPLFCFVQGMESQACYVLRDGALDKIGLQTFPG